MICNLYDLISFARFHMNEVLRKMNAFMCLPCVCVKCCSYSIYVSFSYHQSPLFFSFSYYTCPMQILQLDALSFGLLFIPKLVIISTICCTLKPQIQLSSSFLLIFCYQRASGTRPGQETSGCVTLGAFQVNVHSGFCFFLFCFFVEKNWQYPFFSVS